MVMFSSCNIMHCISVECSSVKTSGPCSRCSPKSNLCHIWIGENMILHRVNSTIHFLQGFFSPQEFRFKSNFDTCDFYVATLAHAIQMWEPIVSLQRNKQ